MSWSTGIRVHCMGQSGSRITPAPYEKAQASALTSGHGMHSLRQQSR